MIDITGKLIEETRFPPSLSYLRLRYYYPPAYYASSIGDFLEHRQEIKVAQRNLIRPERFVGEAAIMIDNCRYRRVADVSKPRMSEAWLWHQDLAWCAFMERLIEISDVPDRDERVRKLREKRERMLSEYHTSIISDITGELSLRGLNNVPVDTFFQQVLFLYQPSTGLTRMSGAYEHDQLVIGGKTDDLDYLFARAGMLQPVMP